MTFSNLIKNNKGNFNNEEISNLHKSVNRKLDNHFINDFTFKGPEFNQRLSIDIYKFIIPKINIYKLYFLDYYMTLLKYNELNKRFYINVKYSKLSNKKLSNLISDIIFKNSLIFNNKNLSKKFIINSLLNYKIKSNIIKFNNYYNLLKKLQNLKLKRLRLLKIKLKKPLRFSKIFVNKL